MVVIVFAVIGIAVAIGREQANFRDKHPVYTTGVVTRFSEVKGSRYVHYTFKVDSTKYEGRVSIEFCLQCKDDCCLIGNKVKVRYAEDAPTNNDLVH